MSKDLVNNGKYNPIKEEAFISVCDLLIVFSHMGEAKAPLKSLQYRPDSHIADLLDQFIQVI